MTQKFSGTQEMRIQCEVKDDEMHCAKLTSAEKSKLPRTASASAAAASARIFFTGP